ncbi:MAG: DUF6134 family protein [Pseudomonadota bacterium]
MIWRTTVLTACAMVMAATQSYADISDTEPGLTQWAPQAGDVISFDVLRQGNEFGRHEVRFDEAENGDLLVETEVRLRAGLGPITLFRYRLETEERWRDGQLIALSGDVNDDGSKESVTAVSESGQLVIDGDGFSGSLDLGILPASHWNVGQTKVEQLLSSENGEILDVAVLPQGRETITVDGETVEANKFLMDSDIDVSLWYDDSGRWLKLSFEARGQAIEYVLNSLY